MVLQLEILSAMNHVIIQLINKENEIMESRSDLLMSLEWYLYEPRLEIGEKKRKLIISK